MAGTLNKVMLLGQLGDEVILLGGFQLQQMKPILIDKLAKKLPQPNGTILWCATN